MTNVDKRLKKKKRISNVDNYKRLLVSNITNLLNYRDQYLSTFILLDKTLSNGTSELSYNVLKSLFPFDYMKFINKNNKGIDPMIILSLIRQESAFNPMAKSSAGARGLMQLMPATARMLRKNVRSKRLHQPKVNIEIGIKYLNRLLKKYEGNLIHTLAAYNAGETALRRWKKNYLHSKDPLVNIEAIPYKETRKYVKLIYRNLFFYRFLSEKENIKRSISSSFHVKAFKRETSAH